MNDFYFGHDLFGELDRMQRQMSAIFGTLPSSIRSGRTDSFPALNVGSTEESIDVVAFAPGIDPASLEITIDKSTLTIAGNRKAPDHEKSNESRVYARERFFGAFRRVVELPQNADSDKIEASYSNGCLVVRIGKREASKPRAITIQ